MTIWIPEQIVANPPLSQIAPSFRYLPPSLFGLRRVHPKTARRDALPERVFCGARLARPTFHWAPGGCAL
jgi:hypothetical protein